MSIEWKYDPKKPSDLALEVTRSMFEAMSEGEDKVQRIEFKGGQYPENETALGGFCEEAFARSLDGWLRQAIFKKTPDATRRGST